MIKKKRKYISKQTVDIRRNRSANKKSYISIVVVLIMIILAIIFLHLGFGVEKNTKPVYQYKMVKNLIMKFY